MAKTKFRDRADELDEQAPTFAEDPPEVPPTAATIAPPAASTRKRRPKLIQAGPCPRSKENPHTDTWIYKTDPTTGVRFAKCNTCGELWKVPGPTGAEIDKVAAAAA